MKTHRRAFIKQLGFGAAALGLFSAVPGCATRPGLAHHRLPRSTPEEQGVSSESILAFLDAAAKSKYEFHSFMMVRHGHVIAEGWWTPYRPGANHMLYSLSKSFTSTAVGFAVTEGRLTVDDQVISFFPDDLPPEKKNDPHLQALKVKHLLTMSVGRARDSMPIIGPEQNWVKKFLSAPIENEPGSVFLYDSGASYMLSAIVQKVSGQRAIDYLRPRLFAPLEIEGMTWETCPRGINTGGWGLSVRTEALAKFGQLYLQNGVWQGRQIIPAAWVHEATTFKIQQPPGKGKKLDDLKKSSDWHQGYCYQFWRCRHNGFRGDGAFGQFMVVLPDEDAVVAITCETSDMQGELNLVWEHLLPGINGATAQPGSSSDDELRKRVSALALPMANGQASSAIARDLSGKVFHLQANDLGIKDVTWHFPAQGGGTFTITDAAGRNTVRCGFGQWIDGICNVPGAPPRLTVGNLLPCKVAASAGWTGDHTLEMLWRYYETPHHDTVTCKFDGQNVSIEFQASLPGHKETRPILRGSMV